MKTYAFTFYVLSVLVVVEKTASAKSFIFNKFSGGPSLDNNKKNDELGYGGTKSDLEKNSMDSSLTSYKRSVDDLNFRPFYKRTQRKRSPYGLVYNQGKPIGILEPISQSFEYSAYTNPRDSTYHSGLYKSQWFPGKREIDLDEERDETDQQSTGLHSNNYANVLAKFKVNNKVKQRPYQDFLYSQQVKRDASRDQTNQQANNQLDDVKKRGAFDIGDLSAPQSAAKAKRSESTTKADKIVEIEENLKDVMNDMGLVEKEKPAEVSGEADLKKREIYFEDEDLENGLNKIGLTKESHYDRNKKENCPGKTKAKSKAGKRQKLDKSAHKKLKKKPEEEPEEEDEDDSKRSISHKHVERKSTYSGDAKAHIANYQSEGEAFIRSKRQEKEGEDADIMKGLEQSGDLTVSGNKSPLVAVTSADELEAKKNQEKRDKEELEYEKRLERNIQAKINAIKEEVKREIGKLKNDDEKLKDMQRKKREIANTLLDEETSALDPGLNIDQKLEPYVRKRRDLEQEALNTETKHQKESRDAINEISSQIKSLGEEAEKNQEKRNAQLEKRDDTRDDVVKDSEEVVKKNKRSEAEIDLSTGKTMIDLGDSKGNDALSDESNSEKEVVENERQERNAKSSKDKDRERCNLKDETDDIAEADRTKRASLEDDDSDYVAQRSVGGQKIEGNPEESFGDKRKYLGNPLYTNVDVDRNARKTYADQEANYGRLERNSKSNDVKILDEDSHIYRQARKRRDAFYKKHKRYARRKRNDFLEEDPDLMGYRAEGDGEIDDEGDEMDDDGFNDQTSNFLLDKRQAADYDQESDGNYDDEINEDYPSYLDRDKRNSDSEEALDSFLFYPSRRARRKRQDFQQLVASHGGETALNHLGAVRERNMRPIEKNYRRKRLEKLNNLHSQKQNIAELSESDIFGGLPQSYEGELSRFKRVKRQT